jgi:hypothetical protein
MCECGEVNTIEHAPNECKLRLIDRDEILKELNGIYMCNKIPARVGLYDYLHFSFFGLDFEKLTIKDRRRTVEIIKSTISKMIIYVEGKTGKIEIDDENIETQDE